MILVSAGNSIVPKYIKPLRVWVFSGVIVKALDYGIVVSGFEP